MISRLVYMSIAAATAVAPGCLVAQAPEASAERIRALEAQLAAAQGQVDRLQGTIDELQAEVAELSERRAEAAGSATGGRDTGAQAASQAAARAEERYTDRILVPDLGEDERASELVPRPELFVQSRYHANPIDEAAEDDVTRNFGLSRMELRWAGRVSSRVGMGYEIQYHPAVDGAAEELVNDAYVEYYPTDALTVRMGQFVKPFGFDIQHSSSVREAPERGIFAGYFFPGQRDRGLMLSAQLDGVASWTDGVSVHAGAFNGNRFFDDNNSVLNFNLRIRKVFDELPLAIGASMQRGTQILPPGTEGTDSEDVYGVDAQYVLGRLGMRAEYVRGNTPSTLLGLEPELVTSLRPGEKSWGAAALFNYRLTQRDDLYWRWDRFENDPVTGDDIRVFNAGYLREIGPNSRIGVDYQLKNDVTFNDDELNTKFTISWNVVY